MAHSLHGEEESATNSDSGQSPSRAGGETCRRENHVMEGFLTEGAFALRPEDWVDLPSME